MCWELPLSSSQHSKKNNMTEDNKDLQIKALVTELNNIKKDFAIKLEEMEDFNNQFNVDDMSIDEEEGLPKGYASDSQKKAEDKLLNTTSTSAWRKNKILKERKKRGDNDDLTIRY